MTKKENKEFLDDLVRAFYYNKTQADEYGKLAKEENEQIKDLMEVLGKDEHYVANLKAKYSIRREDKLDEDKLLYILKDNGVTDCIKTIEVVDMDKLESAIYNNQLDKSLLKKIDTCKSTKEIRVLKVTKNG